MNSELINRTKLLIEKINADEKRKKVKSLQSESTQHDFWKDHKKASQMMMEISRLEKEIDQADTLELLMRKRDEKKLQKTVDELEFKIYLSGKFDASNAIFSLHAGQGGTEAMDWTSMLYRMYTRFIKQKGWSWERLDFTPGDEAGIKSVILHVSGSYAYGFLKAESGVHRLVRQSPFNADNLRQTSFSMAEVYPEIDDQAEIKIVPDDLEWDFFRSSGKGGQNVNKVSTAVRLKHKPSGFIVTCQSERHQAQNRDYALKLLRAKLWAKLEQEQAQEKQNLKGDYKTPGWGNQIRSYVLHPYKLVKDLRTGYQTKNPTRVLDGDIEDFIISYLKKSA